MKFKIVEKKGPPIKLCFFDLDGTLVNSSGEISMPVRREIERIQKAGIITSVVSGRPFFGALKILDLLNIKVASGFFSGALVLDLPTQKPLLQHALAREKALRLVELALDKGFALELYTNEDYFVQKRNYFSEIHASYLNRQPTECDLRALTSSSEILKVVIVTEGQEDAAKCRKVLGELKNCTISYARGAAHPHVLFANVTSAAANREECFRVLTSHFGVSPEQVCSFGDAESDIPFFKLSGRSFAVDNAPLEVKNAASDLTASVEEDGVALALRALFPLKG